MVVQSWSSGEIRRFDPNTKTGVIDDSDGMSLIFHLSEVRQRNRLRAGAIVHFEIDKTKAGAVARNITILEED
jgi:cold shock CspA family protein